MGAEREIKDRIAGIENTMKITNAMYMISSTKLNKARAALVATEPYFYTLQGMYGRVMRHLPVGFEHPYLHKRKVDDPAELRRCIICISADKGMAGAYNHNVLKLTEERLRPDYNDLLFVVGEVGHHYFTQHGIRIDQQFHYTAQKPSLDRARTIAENVLELYANGEIDEVYLIYTRMVNSMSNQPEIIPLLPLQEMNERSVKGPVGAVMQEEFNMFPTPGRLLDNIIPDYLAGFIYSALVESFCAEHSARMQAMDSANKNGSQLVQKLSIQYNRERQARITQEITEVAAGAKARARQIAAAKARKRSKEDANR